MSETSHHHTINNPVRIAIAALLTLASYQMSHLAMMLMHPKSPERAYDEGTLAKRRHAFEELWHARFGRRTPPLAYWGALAGFLFMALGVGAALTELGRFVASQF